MLAAPKIPNLRGFCEGEERRGDMGGLIAYVERIEFYEYEFEIHK